MNNNEMENSIIITRRPKKENEFIFSHNCSILNAENMFRYIEENSNLRIEVIDRDELPMHSGYSGYRIVKDG